MIIYIAVLIILVGVALWKKNYRSQFLKPYQKGLIGNFYPMGLWMYEIFLKVSGKREGEEIRQLKAIYIRDKPNEQMKVRGARTFALIWCCLFFGTALSMLITVTNNSDVLTENGLERPTFGKEKDYNLTIEGISETEQELGVTVHGQQPNEENMTKLFDQLYEKLKGEILGDNRSLEEVNSELNLVSSTDYGVRVQWKSQNSEEISDLGKILIKDIPEEGKLVSFLVTLTYATYESNYELYVKLIPPARDQAYYINLLQDYIHKADEKEAQDPYLKLPEQLEGFHLTYQLTDDPSGWYFWALSLIAAICIYWFNNQQLKKRYEKRNQELMKDYPSLVSKLNLLIGAGMTLRMAWNRIVLDYQKRCDEMGGKRRYAYEEMILTANSIAGGYQEGKAYGEFGRRCAVHAYLKLGNMLEQNLKQGTAGLNQKLEEEMIHALEERKSIALRMGEEAGTKLLLPMFLLMGIIIVILIVPAFLAFR